MPGAEPSESFTREARGLTLVTQQVPRKSVLTYEDGAVPGSQRYSVFGARVTPGIPLSLIHLYTQAIPVRFNILGGAQLIHVAPADVLDWHYVVIILTEQAKAKGWLR